MKRSICHSLRYAAAALMVFAAACSPAADDVEDAAPELSAQSAERVLEDALPNIDEAQIRRQVLRSSELAARPSLRIDAVARRVGLQPTSLTESHELRSDTAVFQFDRESRRAFATQSADMSRILPGARDQAAQYLATFEDILNDAGIAEGERVVAGEPDFIMGHGFKTGADGLEPVSEPVVHAVQVIARRVIDGIPVDGSAARVLFQGPDEVVLADVKWPAFVLHPTVRQDMRFKTRAQLAGEIAHRIGTPADVAHPVRAGLVYHPVRDNGSTYYVPALRVSRNAQDKAGEVFYVDLDADAPALTPAQ